MDAPTLRQTANNLAKVGALLTEEAFGAGGDLAQLGPELATLKAAAERCRTLARRQEARAAQWDDTAPFCMGCQNRTDVPGGIGCALEMETKEACAKRRCTQYKAE